jgi:hypothetical protein
VALVEFVLVLPAFLLLVLGIMEFSLLLRDVVGTSNAVRDASRTASAAPRQGNVEGHKGPAPPAGRVQSFAYDASQVLKKTGTVIPTDSIVDLWVYKANAKGFPDGLSDFSGCPPAVCVRYAWDTVPTPTFEWRSGTWDPASINACPNDANSMAVGVFMRVRHRALFPSFFNVSFDVSDSSVVKFEPLRPGAGSCKP